MAFLLYCTRSFLGHIDGGVVHVIMEAYIRWASGARQLKSQTNKMKDFLFFFFLFFF